MTLVWIGAMKELNAAVRPITMIVQYYAKSIRLGASLYASRVSTLLLYLYTTPP
jgi:hypothetical protein